MNPNAPNKMNLNPTNKMKLHALNLFFATMAGLTVSSNAAVFFTEDFSDNSASPNMALGTGHGSPTTNFTGAFTITSGDGNRIYLGTNDTDYSTADFVFEADVTIPNLGSPWSIAFLGMGSPNANGASYGEPTTNQNVISALRPDEGDGGNLSSRDNGAFAGPHFSGIGLTIATQGMRMEWNATTMQATFLFDVGNDGTYDPALTFVVDGSDNGFDGTNSQLFVGGGNGTTFDNISVTAAVPEPSTALLAGFGLLGLVRRRRA